MENGERTILHLDLDTFFVSVERLQNNRLEGKPVIVGGSSGRSVVAGCSYECRYFGVHSGMPIKMALRLCPSAIIIHGDADLYSRYSNLITEIIAESAPVFEKTSIDEHYLDLTGMDRFFGSSLWAAELRNKIIKNSGLPISSGMSLNKTVSKIATGEAKPNGSLKISANDVQPFLNPLSIRKIPGVGNQNYQKLRTMGVSTIESLTHIPVEIMERVMGKNGVIIWKKANGIDHSPIKPYTERKSISTERTFDTDTTDRTLLDAVIASMVEKLCFKLRKKQKLTSCVTVKIRYSDFNTTSLQKKIPYTAFDHLLLEVVRSLFQKLYNRRMLIRLIGVKFSDLIHGFQQLSLFDSQPNIANLYMETDKMKIRYGSHIIRRASTLYST